MATLKTRPNADCVAEFIDRIADPARQRDARIVCELDRKVLASLIRKSVARLRKKWPTR